MLNKNDRKDAANLITAFLLDKLNQKHFANWHRIIKSNDATVRHVCDIFSTYYDDFEDCLHLMEKRDWDYLERIRLIVMSDAQLVKQPKRAYGLHRGLWLLGVVAFAVFWALTGSGWHLCLATFALSSVLLTVMICSAKAKRDAGPYQSVIEPFVSFHQLESVYRSSDSFRKNHYPKEWWDDDHVGLCGIWLIIVGAVGTVIVTAVLLMLAPALFLTWCLSDCEPCYWVAV